MKTILLIFSSLILVFNLSSCTPLLVGGAAAGGAYAGYKIKEKGYKIKIVKEKSSNSSNTKKDKNE